MAEEAAKNKDVSSVIIKEELHIEETQSEHYSEQYSLPVVNTVIKEKFAGEGRIKLYTCKQEIWPLAYVNNDMKKDTNPEVLNYKECSVGSNHSDIDTIYKDSSCSSALLKQDRSVDKNEAHQNNVCYTFLTHQNYVVKSNRAPTFRKYSCDVCNKAFFRIGVLFCHRLRHDSIKKYQCDVCNKIFTCPGDLRSHKFIHSGITKYQCDICNRSFIQSHILSAHKLRHADTNKYECEVCNKIFANSNSLSRHKLLVHCNKKYQCDVCNRTFNEFRELSDHKLRHVGMKIYHCEICNKVFANSSNVSRHKVIHSVVKK